MAETSLATLHSLARLYDVQPSYFDVRGVRRHASPEGLLAVLRALGAPVQHPRDVASALRARREELCRRLVDPIAVVWAGTPGTLELRLPAKAADRALRCSVRLESGRCIDWSPTSRSRRTRGRAVVEGTAFLTERLRIPDTHLPIGYHELSLEIAGLTQTCQLVVAPVRAYGPTAGDGSGLPRKTWGVFLPLYALHSERSWGAGDFGDLRALMDWTAELGGGVVATLPLLAAFLDEPYEPSPYSPVSRLFWNEFYIEPAHIPELRHCGRARELLSSPRVQEECRALRASPVVDYKRQMAVKREVLEALAKFVTSGGSPRRDAFRRYVAEHPVLTDYARFRAVCERERSPWQQWPARLRGGDLRPGDFADDVMAYHLYVQWVAHDQLSALARQARQHGEGLYLDLPLGVHDNGYDVWRERSSFVLDASGGAPPDSVYTKGQDWGFAPLHPQGIRESRYRHVIAYLRHHMSLAKVLRIDHVMGMHRLYMVPKSYEATQGVFVRYRAEELYAILSLESHRHQTWLVGENLGTVPRHVNAALRRHGVHGMYVVQYELTPKARPVLPAVPARSVASLNTHDMPPFAAYCEGLDTDDRVAMGLMTEAEAVAERRLRKRLTRKMGIWLRRRKFLAGDPQRLGDLLQGCLAFLSESRAPLVLVNLEDLWLETEPQNVPNSKQSRPNWARKARYDLDTMTTMSQLSALLRRVGELRASPRRRRSR